ncbi:MAG: hypothetical protein ABSG33_08390 [Candidatus Bathyarchaeia archaeon]|jgi:hypothetical protein
MAIPKELYLELLKGQEEAERIWGIKVPFILDETISNEHILLRGQKLAEHLWYNDANKIYYKGIEILCQKYNVDFSSVLRYCICHETGHAKEQRLFQEIGYFPFRTKNLPIKPILRNNEFYSTFSNGIWDFSINQELAKQNIINKLFKPMFFDTTDLKEYTSRFGDESEFKLTCLLSLPNVLDVYEHSGLNEGERMVLRESHLILADFWDRTLSTLQGIKFFDPASKINITIELLRELLGVNAFLDLEDHKFLFSRYPNLPKFWSKKAYQILKLC